MFEKVNLVISFEVKNVRKFQDLIVTILGNEYVIPNHRSLTITIDRGNYDLLFKIPFLIKTARLEHHLALKGDMHLEIGWSKMWGRITVKEIVTHVIL